MDGLKTIFLKKVIADHLPMEVFPEGFESLLTEVEPPRPYSHFLEWSEKGLRLKIKLSDRWVCVFSDFLSGAVGHRGKSRVSKNDLFAKAMGVKHNPTSALDLTGGFGVDSYIMLGLGLRVTTLERSPLVFSLLRDGFRRWKNYSAKPFDGEWNILCQESLEYLKMAKENSFDVIYYDPMYPEKQKTALSSKEMQALQELLPVEASVLEEEVLAEAVRCAKMRVVVKRPLKAKPILPRPSHQFSGKSVRYDMYLSDLK